MPVLRRRSVHKKHSAKQFCKDCERTKSLNLSPAPMRGGIRL